MFDFWNNVKPLPNLAKGTLTLNAEAVYKAPADYNEIIRWSVFFEVKFGILWGVILPIIIYLMCLHSVKLFC